MKSAPHHARTPAELSPEQLVALAVRRRFKLYAHIYNAKAKRIDRKQVGGYPLLPRDCRRCAPRNWAAFGCQRFGAFVRHGDPWKIDNTGDKERDGILFCPKSIDLPLLERAVSWVLTYLERPLDLFQAYGRPIRRLPARTTRFTERVFAAWRRLLAERDEIER